ncbi:hypothetical protein HA402_009046 [Bradysia odoriphaga]|nr:hypothetical protein HA402_009046 [Bradysia odoriphaga]
MAAPNSVPTAVLPEIESNEYTSTTSAEMESLEDQFAKLPMDRLAAEMWKSAMKNMPDLSGPATADLITKKLDNFKTFITSISSKQNFCDAVKDTCRERCFSKGIARKIQKQANDVKVQDHS